MVGWALVAGGAARWVDSSTVVWGGMGLMRAVPSPEGWCRTQPFTRILSCCACTNPRLLTRLLTAQASPCAVVSVHS